MQNVSVKFRILSLVIAFILVSGMLPVTTVHASASSTLREENTVTLKKSDSSQFEEFTASLKKSDASQLVGVYVKDVMALTVVQQASTYSVSSKSGTVTQFGLAGKYGSIGLLAHNYLSGSNFSKLGLGTEIILIFGDGSIKTYKVNTLKKYQALSPSDPFSNFINLDKPNVTITSDNVVNETYGAGDLVLQTCIKQNGVSAWGRLFIIASLVE